MPLLCETGPLASGTMGHERVPVSVELDDECQGGIEPDVILAMGDQALS